MMPRLERTNPLVVLAAAAMGAAAGLLLQFVLSGRGHSPFVPPVTLAVSLAVLAGVILFFGIRLRRQVARRPGAINPFHAVRLLASARAGQLLGAALGGFGGGLWLSLLGRTVPANATTWAPMAAVFAGGLLLVICAAITEHFCRVPPDDGEAEGDSADGRDHPLGGAGDRPAYRSED